MRLRIFFTSVALLLISSFNLLAQTDPGEPCGGAANPDEVCPLDTWIVVLAIAALFATAIHLYRKQKSLQA